jgi:hypothetical protein
MAPSKSIASLVSEVLSARIHALGIGTFSSSGGYTIDFTLPLEGPSDASIREVLSATGDVHVVPLPTSDYGDGKLAATIGEPLPKVEPSLFGWAEIASITIDSDAASPVLLITLKPTAAQAFADYTTGHVGETFAIVVDDRVRLLPAVMEVITSGQIAINAGDGDTFAETAAILAGGLLPEAWRGASVPVLLSQDQAEAVALTARPGASVRNASISVEGTLEGADLKVVWNVEVVVSECPENESCVWAPGAYVAKVNAVTGSLIHVGTLEP